jgi:hypothetical protein
MSFTRREITTHLFECHCERCNHDWESVGQEPPRVCAACKSSGWNRPEGRRTLAQRLILTTKIVTEPAKPAKAQAASGRMFRKAGTVAATVKD